MTHHEFGSGPWTSMPSESPVDVGIPRLVLMPAYNEASHIAAAVQAVRTLAPGFLPVVIDDGSLDDTGAIATRSGAFVLTHPFNLGYGAALQTGYHFALRRRAELIVQLDADGQHDPADITALISPIVKEELDLVIGSRFLDPDGYPESRARRLARLILKRVGGSFGVSITDLTSGFQAMNRRVLVCYTGEFFPADYPDADVLVRAKRHGLRIGERPVTMRSADRPSRLFIGLAPVYYFYRLALALWARDRSADHLKTREGDRG